MDRDMKSRNVRIRRISNTPSLCLWSVREMHGTSHATRRFFQKTNKGPPRLYINRRVRHASGKIFSLSSSSYAKLKSINCQDVKMLSAEELLRIPFQALDDDAYPTPTSFEESDVEESIHETLSPYLSGGDNDGLPPPSIQLQRAIHIKFLDKILHKPLPGAYVGFDVLLTYRILFKVSCHEPFCNGQQHIDTPPSAAVLFVHIFTVINNQYKMSDDPSSDSSFFSCRSFSLTSSQ